MKNAVIILGALWSGVACPHFASGQACTPRAMQSVYEAQSKLAAGNTAAAAQLLEKAADLCVNSCRVFVAVAETYAKMNNVQLAARYQDFAKSLGCSTTPNL